VSITSELYWPKQDARRPGRRRGGDGRGARTLRRGARGGREHDPDANARCSVTTPRTPATTATDRLHSGPSRALGIAQPSHSSNTLRARVLFARHAHLPARHRRACAINLVVDAGHTECPGPGVIRRCRIASVAVDIESLTSECSVRCPGGRGRGSDQSRFQCRDADASHPRSPCGSRAKRVIVRCPPS